jgi:ABC-type Fe3+/spermidine/putrescine transport system ATPase subunit
VERLIGNEGRCLIRVEGLPALACRNPAGRAAGDHIRLSIRPEKLCLGPTPPESGFNAFQGRVEEVVYMGAQTRYHVSVNHLRLAIAHLQVKAGQPPPARGDVVWAWFHEDDGRLLDAGAGGGDAHG